MLQMAFTDSVLILETLFFPSISGDLERLSESALLLPGLYMILTLDDARAAITVLQIQELLFYYHVMYLDG